MPQGICKLCLQVKDLQASHLMPRSLYKKARSSEGTGNQDPLLVTTTERRRTSYQITDYVLCRQCEQRFNKNGENYVMRIVTTQDLQFPLLNALKKTSPSASGDGWASYSAADTPDINRDQIAYFAISVFWRASVHTWERESGELVSIDLGKEYNEQIRKYLLGEAPLPARAVMNVVACTERTSQISFFMPSENKKVRDGTVGFGARGLLFFFRVSRTHAPWQRRISMINNANGWIAAYDCLKHDMWHLGN